jgi:hypothetical protein
MGAQAWGTRAVTVRGRRYLLELHEVCLQALGFLLILFGCSKDLLSGGTSVFQLSLEVLHLSLSGATKNKP